MHYLSLVFTSFLAGSFFMASSEAHMAILLNKGLNAYYLLACATIGNTLGGMTCYLIARIGGEVNVLKYLKIKEEKIKKGLHYIEKLGVYIALLTWLPFIGEVLCVALGLAKKDWRITLLFMGLARGLRYLTLIFIFT